MKIKTIAAVLLAAGVASAAFTSAVAAPVPATAPTTPIATGPAIPGICLLSLNGMLANSLVGKSVATRLGQLQAVVAGELNTEQTALQAEQKAIEAKRSTQSTDQFAQTAAQFDIKGRNFQREVDLRQRELQATQDKQFKLIVQQADPLIRQVVAEKSCSVVIDAQAILVGNPGMDITSALVQRLDGKIQTLAFDREHLDTGTNAPPAQ